jgi:hypothetical protein
MFGPLQVNLSALRCVLCHALRWERSGGGPGTLQYHILPGALSWCPPMNVAVTEKTSKPVAAENVDLFVAKTGLAEP